MELHYWLLAAVAVVLLKAGARYFLLALGPFCTECRMVLIYYAVPSVQHHLAAYCLLAGWILGINALNSVLLPLQLEL